MSSPSVLANRPLSRLVTLVTAFAVAVASSGLPALAQMGAPTGAQEMTRADYEACQARDETAFRTAVADITAKSLRKSLQGIEFQRVIDAEWRRAGVDAVMDGEVDKTIGQMRKDTSWLDMWGTLFSSEKAQRIATAASERVYSSEAIKRIIGELANGIGREVGQRMEIATIDAAEPAVLCVQAFLGPRYGATVARTVGSSAGREFAIDPEKAKAGVSTGAVLAEGSEGIAGAVVLLVRRQLSGLAGRVGQRIVGAVLGRIVAVVAGGVGVVLIAKDAWDFRHGVLPIVAQEMKSVETKAKIRQELAKASSEQIGEQLQTIANGAADRIVEIWHEFRRAHAKVLELSEKNEAFKRFLEAVKPDRLARLDETIAIITASEGEAAVLKRLENGTLHRAVHTMPNAAMDIARELRSLDAAMAWGDIAGDHLGRIVEWELHKRTPPTELTKGSLQRLLGLGDRVAASRLASLKAKTREPLLDLSDSELRTLGRGLEEADLAQLSGYLLGLERPAAQRLLKVVATSPARMQALSSARVRQAILSSRDQLAAIDMMTGDDGMFHLTDFIAEARMAWERRISPLLLWERHPSFVLALGVGTFLFLMLLSRLIFRRRRA